MTTWPTGKKKKKKKKKNPKRSISTAKVSLIQSIGNRALYSHNTGDENVAVGVAALAPATPPAPANTAIGIFSAQSKARPAAAI